MTMNIKNAEAHRLARELAEITGESLTTAVTVAVRERLEREKTARRGGRKRDDLVERLMEIGRRTAPQFRAAGITVENFDDFLYDEDGLPR
jgi:antitoxin VapB